MLGGFRLEYNVVRPYPWRNFTWITILGFSLLLVALSVVNVALVGYELVTVTSNNFNITYKPWYHAIASLSKQQESCQPAVFSVGDTFRTSVGAFDYQIHGISATNDSVQFQLPSLPSTEYRNVPLSGCDVRNMSLSSAGLTFYSAWTATIVCPPPFGVRATMTWVHGSPDQDTLVQFFGTIGSLTPASQDLAALHASSAVAIQDVLAAVDDDFINENRDDPAASFLFNFVAQPNCTASACTQAEKEGLPGVQKNPDYDWNRVGADGSFSAAAFPEWGFASNRTALNTFQVLLAAVRLDLGNVSPNNIFTNMTALRNTVFLSTISTHTSQVLNGTGYNSLAQLPVTPMPQVVANVNYLCSRAKLKNFATLISAVFASTATELLAVWGVLSLVAGHLARKHDRTRGRIEDHSGKREGSWRSVSTISTVPLYSEQLLKEEDIRASYPPLPY